MKKNQPLVLTIVILLAFGLLTACGGGATTPAPTNLTIDMAEFMFNPATVTVPAGGQVNLTLTNSGTLEHEWVIMNLGAQVTPPFGEEDEANIYWERELEPGGSTTETFTAPTEPGEYQIICGIAGHLEAGMAGTLVVQ